VKCFKLLYVVLFLFSHQLYGQALNAPQYPLLLNGVEKKIERVDSVVPIRKKEIVNGEIYTVKIISEKTQEELKTFKNKMINEVMYVMEVHILDEERHFKVFITDPPKKKKKEILFDMSSFKYSPTNKGQSPEYLKIDTPYSLDLEEGTQKIIIASLFTLISLIILWFLRKYILVKKNLRKKKKEELRQAKELIKLLENPKTREDFEMIYLERKEITRLLDFNRPQFLKLLNEINKFQYKKLWSDEDLVKVIESFKKLEEFRVSGGI
jgi:hypothetical protein